MVETTTSGVQQAIRSVAHRLTGWNARVSENGKPRSIDEAAQKIAEECVP